jgi:hypothetical protein
MEKDEENDINDSYDDSDYYYDYYNHKARDYNKYMIR